MRILLRRFRSTLDGTGGRLYIPAGAAEPFAYTLEEEDVGNAPNVSSIPAGEYRCERTVYHKYGYETFEVTGVPGRSRILFHPGNTEEDTQGCILLGDSMGPLEVVDEDSGERVRKIAVLNSNRAFRRFMSKLHDVDEFDIEITDPIV